MCIFATFATEVNTAHSNDRVESSATFATKEETAQFSRQSRYSILFETKVEVARLRKRHQRKNQRRNRPVRRVKNLLISNFHERVGDGAIFATKAETAQPRNNYSWRSRTRWRRCDFRDRGSDGTTSTTKAEKTRLSRSRQRRRSFPNQGRNGATKKHFLATLATGGYGTAFATRLEMIHDTFFAVRRRRRDVPEKRVALL